MCPDDVYAEQKEGLGVAGGIQLLLAFLTVLSGRNSEIAGNKDPGLWF